MARTEFLREHGGIFHDDEAGAGGELGGGRKGKRDAGGEFHAGEVERQ